MKLALALALGVALTACGGKPKVGDVVAPADRAADWRQVATQADRERLRNWRDTWVAALTEARAADAGAIAEQGALFEPDRALETPVPPAGAYRCRTFKLGAKGTATLPFTVYPWFECRVDDEGEVISFKTSGSQRPVGLIFPDGAARAVFLGTLVLGDETGVLEYGRDANRDMAGFVERIGPRRWRIALPAPKFESQLDVMELVPAG